MCWLRSGQGVTAIEKWILYKKFFLPLNFTMKPLLLESWLYKRLNDIRRLCILFDLLPSILREGAGTVESSRKGGVNKDGVLSFVNKHTTSWKSVRIDDTKGFAFVRHLLPRQLASDGVRAVTVQNEVIDISNDVNVEKNVVSNVNMLVCDAPFVVFPDVSFHENVVDIGFG